MSEEGVKSAEEKAAEARRGPNRAGGMGGGRGPMGIHARREVAELRPLGQAADAAAATASGCSSPSSSCSAVVSVVLTAVGPKMLGHATNIIVDGVLRQADAGRSHPATGRRPAAGVGQTQQADLIAAMNLVPGQGIDFTALGRVLLLRPGALPRRRTAPVVVRAGSSRGVVTAHHGQAPGRCRGEARPTAVALLRRQPRGELLSRVTNDIDNIQRSLQQTLSQLLTSLLTVVGDGRDDVLDLAARWR